MIWECATNDNLADGINNDDDDEIGQMPADMKDIDGGDKREGKCSHLNPASPPLQGVSCKRQWSHKKRHNTGGWTNLHWNVLHPCLDQRPCSAAGAPSPSLRRSRRATRPWPGEEFGRGAWLTSLNIPSSTELIEQVAFTIATVISSFLLSSWAGVDHYKGGRGQAPYPPL